MIIITLTILAIWIVLMFIGNLMDLWFTYPSDSPIPEHRSHLPRIKYNTDISSSFSYKTKKDLYNSTTGRVNDN